MPRLLVAAGLASAVLGQSDFHCPQTRVNPAAALGWGWWSMMPTPGSPAKYWTIGGVTESEFYISATTIGGIIQVGGCAGAENAGVSLPDFRA
jgi:hypothetical protein